MVTPEAVAAKASRITGLTITAQMVREIDNARKQLRAMEKAKTAKSGPTTVQCVCGCGKTFVRTHPRAKIHPECRKKVYNDKGLLAVCKMRTPEVVQQQ